ncbi:MAG: hypothetical protein QME51_05030 [Planctomycetota bacterium]|nr:hypothetical protein [Planctomycetota bacterium]MDI6787715.1 hypothetical protein [Planctomycetota bacterium]
MAPSSRAYDKYVNPDFVSKAGLTKKEIAAKHAKNLEAGYGKYKNKLQYLFETVDGVSAKRYKEIVKYTAKNYGKNAAAKLLAFTGTKVHGRGCAVQVIDWLSGKLVDSALASIKIITGEPIAIAQPGIRSALRASFGQRLTQAGAIILRSDFDADIIKKQNDLTNGLANALCDPALNLVPFQTDGASHVDYRRPISTPGEEDSFFRISVKVSQK